MEAWAEFGKTMAVILGVLGSVGLTWGMIILISRLFEYPRAKDLKISLKDLSENLKETRRARDQFRDEKYALQEELDALKLGKPYR